MLYLAEPFLEEKEHQEFRNQLLSCSEWTDGAQTASGSTKKIKKNLQLADGVTYQELSKKLLKEVKKNKKIINFAFPHKIFNLLFTRTGVGMFYGPHIDIVSGGMNRRDLSFTIFLNDKNEYKGGELILYIPPEVKSIKLNAGEIIIYPTKYLHEVKEVTEGERLVCVGWIESEIARDDDREMLNMLKQSSFEILNNKASLKTILNLKTALNNIHKRFRGLC